MWQKMLRDGIKKTYYGKEHNYFGGNLSKKYTCNFSITRSSWSEHMFSRHCAPSINIHTEAVGHSWNVTLKKWNQKI